jgi:hypothetical protein
MTYSLSEASRALSYGSRLEIPSIFAVSRDPRAVMNMSDLRIQDVTLESKSYAIFVLKVLAHEEPFFQGPLVGEAGCIVKGPTLLRWEIRAVRVLWEDVSPYFRQDQETLLPGGYRVCVKRVTIRCPVDVTKLQNRAGKILRQPTLTLAL